MKRLTIGGGLLALVLLAGTSPCFARAQAGAKRWSAKVPANDKVVYHIAFKAGETAEFAILGDGDTDVDIFVYDQAGNLVVADVGLTDMGLVRWRPDQDQVYRI